MRTQRHWMSGMRFKAANGARPEAWLRKLLRSLDFRIVVPIVLMMSLLGVGAYAVMLKTIASFADERIYEDLKRSSTDLESAKFATRFNRPAC
jgi:hypothetical protein